MCVYVFVHHCPASGTKISGALKASVCHSQQSVCVSFAQVLESFKIMDYSLLLGVHNMDQAERERQMEGSQGGSDQKRPVAQQKALYSTAMESIQGGAACGGAIDTDDT